MSWDFLIQLVPLVAVATSIAAAAHWAGKHLSPKLCCTKAIKRRVEISKLKEQLKEKKETLQAQEKQRSLDRVNMDKALAEKDKKIEDLYARLQAERDQLEQAFRYRWAASEIRAAATRNTGQQQHFETHYLNGKSIDEMIPPC